MNTQTEHKVVLVTQKTRLQELVCRYNTLEQAKFFIEHNGGDFSDYQKEDEAYRRALRTVLDFLEPYARTAVVDRVHISNYLFGRDDLVIALGRDGLVANVLKYLDTQRLIGVNPDPYRWDGVLVAFAPKDLPLIVPDTFAGKRRADKITLAQAQLNDGQSICAVNDIFIGQKSHVSARYALEYMQQREVQSSSGIIVSTGLGKTGWLKSVLAGVREIDRYFGIGESPALPQEFQRNSAYLYFAVREPYESTSTAAGLVFGKVDARQHLTITSMMAENGVIFSDGVEEDYLQFNAGAIATVSLAEKVGHLVV